MGFDMLRFLFLALFMATSATAQSFPEYTSITVNDFADLLGPEDEAALSADLDALRKDTGVEMTVVTLERQADFAPDLSMEAFATQLFDAWGVGNADRNDGVMVLVLRQDRAMRIELGAAFGRDWDKAAARVVDGTFLPAFREGDYAAGIMAGSQATIDDIVRPFLAGTEPPSGVEGPEVGLWLFGGIAAFFTLLIARRRIGDFMARFRTCPSCGARALRQTSRTIRSATKTATGRGRRRVICQMCDYTHESEYIIPKRSSSSGSSFGGGRSGGGGASGRW